MFDYFKILQPDSPKQLPPEKVEPSRPSTSGILDSLQGDYVTNYRKKYIDNAVPFTYGKLKTAGGPVDTVGFYREAPFDPNAPIYWGNPQDKSEMISYAGKVGVDTSQAGWEELLKSIPYNRGF